MIFFLIIRLFVYLFLRMFGVSFWILPEIMNDKLKPYYSFEKVQNTKLDIFIRAVIVFILSFLVYKSYINRNDIDFIKDKLIESNQEIVVWVSNFVKFDNTGKIKK